MLEELANIISALIKVSPFFGTVGGMFFAYHKFIQSRIDEKVDKHEYEKDLQHNKEKNEEIENLIKEVRTDIKEDLKEMKDDIKRDIEYLRDRQCVGTKIHN